MSYGFLAGASVLEAYNVRELSEDSSRAYSVVFGVGGGIEIHRRKAFGGSQPLLVWPIYECELYLGSQTESSGGAFIGGGFGDDAAAGMAAAAFANLLTSSSDNYLVLTLAREHESGAEQAITLGYRNADEIAVREYLSQVIPQWIHAWWEGTMSFLADGEMLDEHDAQFFVWVATSMRDRGFLEADARDEMLALIVTRAPEIEALIHGDAITPKADAGVEQDLAGQLAGLASLHAAGALTDEEFSAAKARLLR